SSRAKGERVKGGAGMDPGEQESEAHRLKQLRRLVEVLKDGLAWLAEHRRRAGYEKMRRAFFGKRGARRRRTFYEKLAASQRRQLDDPHLFEAARANLDDIVFQADEAVAWQARQDARTRG